MVSTAKHANQVKDQLLEGTCFLDVGTARVLVYQILRSLGRRELGYNILEVSFWFCQNETGI